MKVTNEDFLRRLSAKNPNIEPLEQYKGSSVNILCRCKVCSHEWMVRPGNLLSGKGCPICAIERNAMRRTKSQDQFLAELSFNNPTVDSLEPYRGMGRKILFHCRNCGYKWHARPDHALNGHGCPVCGGSMQKDHKTFLEQLAKINPMIEPLEPYINARKKILCRCGFCKNEWYGTPDKLLQGNSCPNCDKRNKSSFPEQAIYYYLRKVYPDAVNRYCLPHTRTEVDIFLPSVKIGIEYDGIFWHKSKAEHELKKYRICKENGITLYRVRESLKQVDGISDGTFIRSKPYNFDTLDAVLKDLFFEMGLVIEVNTFADSANIREQFYTELSKNSLALLYPEVAKEWHPERNGAITPNMVSYGCNEKFWWLCPKCKNEWLAVVASRTTRGRGCPVCGRNSLALKLKKKNEVFVEQLKLANPNLEPLEDYKTTHENILIRCKVCGHEWPAAPANLLRGRDCPKCSRARGIAKMTETKRTYWRMKKQNAENAKKSKFFSHNMN